MPPQKKGAFLKMNDNRNGIEAGRQIDPRLFEEGSSENEVTQGINKVFVRYGQDSVDILRSMVKRGEARAVVSSVPGRPEDEQLAIDAIGEHILTGLVRDNNLPAVVLGEHNFYDLSRGNPQAIIAIDSFDNTSQYKRGLDTSPYTVVGGYSPDGTPLACVVGDIKDRKAYVSINGNNCILDFETVETRRIHRSERTTIKDDALTLASYLGSNEYSLEFFQLFGRLIKDMPPKAVLYAGGGAFIYGLLASGAVDAYVMVNEPYSEIFPGLPIALAAGCTVVSVNPDGSCQEVQFSPDVWKDPNLYNEGSVPLLIAACTPELRDEIIKYYLEAQQEMTEEQALRGDFEEFLASREKSQ